MSAAPSLAGATTVVTGAASGIGRALADRLAAAGAKVAMLDRDEAALRREAQRLESARAEILVVPCDVTDEVQVADAVAGVQARWGDIDVLVNNAGITHIGELATTDSAVFRAVMNVNFFGALYCTKAALPSLRRSGGAIVAISSVAGFAPLLGRSGYAASKHALHGLFSTLRCELADEGVNVMLVCPGFTDTAIEAHALGQATRKTFGRLADPDDVAQAIIRGLAHRRRTLVLTPVGKAAWWISRLFPTFYERMMTRRMT